MLACEESRNGEEAGIVVELSKDDIQKINSVRLILEAEALRLGRFHLTKAAVARLDRMVTRLDQPRGLTTEQRIKKDYEFHRSLWNLSGNQFLRATLENLVGPLFAQCEKQVLKTKKTVSLLSHRPLLDFLEGKSSLDAEEVLEEHLHAYW